MATLTDDCWAFEHGGVRGYVRGGERHGVELTAGPDQEPVTRVMNLNLEHYAAADRPFGEFVPRHVASVATSRVGPRTVRVRVEPTGAWPVETTLTIRFLDEPARTIEAEYEFAAESPVVEFEAFVSNYCHDDRPPVVRFDGEWDRPDLGPEEHRFWLHPGQSADALSERYPSPFMDLDVTVGRTLGAPVLCSPVPGADRTVVRAVERGRVASLSANRRFNAHDLSLVGRDLDAGETVSSRVWTTYLDGTDPSAACAWYDDVRSRRGRE